METASQSDSSQGHRKDDPGSVCMLTPTLRLIPCVVWENPPQCVNCFLSVSAWKQPAIALLASHFHVHSLAVAPVFKGDTSPYGGGSVSTLWHCNWVKQKAPKIDCSLLLQLLCLKTQLWFSTGSKTQASTNPDDIHKRKASHPGRRIQMAAIQSSLLAYECLIYFDAGLSLGVLMAKHLSSQEK